MARKYHCFFEQSGTFKNAIKKLGGVAIDYDILNDYGETDKVIDLYDEIERAYLELGSIFDKIDSSDVILAFFPCTEFEDQKNMAMLGNQYQQKNWSDYKKLNYNLYLHEKLSKNYQLITKLVLVCIRKNIPLVIENPAGNSHYLKRNWSIKPKIIDYDRTMNGDWFKKPTQYWFVNFEPQQNLVFEPLEPNEYRFGGVEKCNTRERSEISPQYAERFIKQYIAEERNGEFIV